MKHFIGRQTIEVAIRQKAGAFEWQQTLSRRFQEDIVPALERLFDRMADETEYLRLDKLEIDLGVISEKEVLSGEWVKKIIAQMETALLRAVQKAEPGAGKTTPALRRFDLWIHFLQHGNLPRFTPAPGADWSKEVLDTLGLQAAAAAQLRQLLARSPRALERLVLQYPDEFLVHIVELFTGQNQKDLASALQEIKAFWGKMAARRWTANEARELTPMLQILFPTRFGKDSAPTAAEIKAFLKKSIPQTQREIEIAFWKKILQLLFKSAYRSAPNGYLILLFREEPGFRAMAAVYESLYGKEGPTDSIIAPILREFTPSTGSKKAQKRPSLLPEPGGPAQTPDADKTEAPTKPEPSADQEGRHIATAGVVLLHPFLTPFFRKRALIEPDSPSFLDDWCRQKAVHLIHFLACGEEGPAEHQLSLAKLLCGIPLDQPVDHAPLLSAADKAEANALLLAVVEHWGALGNTSPDGLREGFLIREGKLSAQNNGWRLQVEYKTIDILLSKLPWGLGVVKTPWMKEFLFVEWN